jgi:anti-sigma B factor antagonist
VSDSARNVGTLPGALLRTLAAQHMRSPTPRLLMTVTGRPPSARAAVASDPRSTPIVRSEGTRTVVVPRGEADFFTSPALLDVLSQVIDLRAGDVVVDLGAVDFIDSAAVPIVARARHSFADRGRKLTFRSPSRVAARLLDLFGLSDYIEVGEEARAMSVDRRRRRAYNPEHLRGVT